MKDFNALTQQGQARRLRKLAENALEQYPIQPARISFSHYDLNCGFRVETTDGKRFMLVVRRPEYTVEETRSEMMWMDALREESEISVSTPLKTCDGDFVAIASAEGVPQPQQCVIFKWIKGQTLSDINPNLAYQWGILSARLHQHALTYRPPNPSPAAPTIKFYISQPMN